jgi:carboxyl-terminal processing protease
MKSILGRAVVLALLLAFAAGREPVAQTSGQAGGGGNTSETYRQLNLFGDVFDRLRADYVDQVGDEKLIEDAINGMLSALDPHSSFMNAKSFRDMQVQTRGEFGGLGIEVTMENGLVKVVSPIDDTPAYRAGVKPGDLITHLDGEAVMGLSLNEAVEKMRGAVNTPIKLTIRREGSEPFDITVTRDLIKIQSVRSRTEGNIGYVRITTFSEQTDVGLRRAVQQIKEKLGDKMIGLVLDMRNNPGGLLDQAVAVSDAFLDKGEIVSTRGRRAEDATRYNAKPGDLVEGLPMVVLINGGSASASEIVAGALQDHRRAVVLGTRSFGKGSVQTIIPLGSHGAMRLTTARYYTPSGRSIQAKGIEPDIEVQAARIEAINEGARRREADLRGALSGDPSQRRAPQGQPPQGQAPQGQPPQGQTPPGQTPPGQTPPASAENVPPTPAEDYQLSRALDLLRGLALFSKKAAN